MHINDDPLTGTVVIDGEAIETTPEHPFYTVEHGWVLAKDLQSGDHVPNAVGGSGRVDSVRFEPVHKLMYNLTVAVDHTFFVGKGGWLVHNAGCGIGLTDRGARRQAMREQGIPTSQQPAIQIRTSEGPAYVYDVPKPGGGTRPMVVGRQIDPRVGGHGIHWEAGAGKTDPFTGRLRWTEGNPPRPLYSGHDRLVDRWKSRVPVGRFY